MTPGPSRRLAIAVAGMLGAAGLAALAVPHATGPKSDVGLFGTLPIYWGERGSIGELLDDSGEPHWVRSALETDYGLVLLDTLDDPALAKLDRLVLAQPRPLGASENVALDEWVRSGGRLLLFADPMLTEHSRFGLGDPRRPQDTVLLSPILRRWGLELVVDEEQADTEREVVYRDMKLPVELPGALTLTGSGTAADCKLESEGVIAICRIGKGRALVVADAALLETERAGGEPALGALLQAILD